MPIEAFIKYGNESESHIRMKHWIGERAKNNGYSVHTEHKVDFDWVDVFAEKEGEVVAYECLTSPYNGIIEGKIGRYKRIADKVVIIVPNNVEIEKIRKDLLPHIIVSPITHIPNRKVK